MTDGSAPAPVTAHRGAAPFDRAAAAGEASRFFEQLWAPGDPWQLDTSPFDQQRYARQLALLDDRRYHRALEVGCGAGAFTERLVRLCDSLVAIEISEAALRRAGERLSATAATLRRANVMDLDPAEEGPWDLVVIAETIYYLGWLYPMFDVAWLLHALHEATNPGGHLLLSDTISDDNGIMSHRLIDAYRDLAIRVGYEPEKADTLRGTKDGVDFVVRLDLFRKAT